MPPGTASLAGETRREDTEYSTRPAPRFKARFFSSGYHERARRGKFPRCYQRESREGCTRAPCRDAFTSSPRFIPRTVVPNCSVRFHLTHVALECRAGALIEKQRQVPNVHTIEKRQRIPSLAREKFNAVLLPRVFVKAHRHSAPRNRCAAAELPRASCERFLPPLFFSFLLLSRKTTLNVKEPIALAQLWKYHFQLSISQFEYFSIYNGNYTRNYLLNTEKWQCNNFFTIITKRRVRISRFFIHVKMYKMYKFQY